MAFQVLEIDPATDFEELIACQWVSYENPLQPFFRAATLENGVEEYTQRQKSSFKLDPSQRWLKVVNSEGNIIGGALWKVYTANPFENSTKFEAVWYPEGGQRDYFTALLRNIYSFREKAGRRPQLYLHAIFTHPDYRHRGIGDQLMHWGIEKANELGVEMWIGAASTKIQNSTKTSLPPLSIGNLAAYDLQRDRVVERMWSIGIGI
ncbi:hypothetical protein PT974_01331 [Cladobotryum mycophilum]|uniref:N-acetyltransferase domain-containing protein n=1 Tax=Cladobotryum mycophilum TaxID=491253 RepID=A0ABR0T3N8_9HYPO